MRLTAFSYLIANGDLHAKNVSLLLSEDRMTFSLSPAYDLLTTLPYGDASMALPLEGRDKKLRRSHFVNFAARFGVRAAATHAVLDEVCHAVRARRWPKRRLCRTLLDSRSVRALSRPFASVIFPTSAYHRRDMRGLWRWMLAGVGWVALGCSSILGLDEFEDRSETGGAGGLGGAAGGSGAGGTGASPMGGGGAGGTGAVPTGGAGGVAGSGASGGAAAGGGGAPSGGSGGTAPKEICDNGTDDDGDSKPDCLDEECVDWSCADAAPNNWQGPVAFWQGPGAPPTCSGAYFTEVLSANADLEVPPAQCSQCTCSASVTNCGASTLYPYTTNQCGTGCAAASLPLDACQDVDLGSCAGGFYVINGPTVNMTSCSPSPQNPTLPAWSWKSAAIACAPGSTAAGCGQGACLPKPPPPFQAQLCVYANDDLPCPPGVYSKKLLVHDAAQEGRSCTECTCGSPQGGVCNATLERYFSAGCQDFDAPGLPIGAPTCTASSGAYASFRVISGTSGGASCSPSGGTPSGSVVPVQTHTVCCVP